MSWRYGLSIIRLPDGSDYYEVREFHRGVLSPSKYGWSSWTQNPVSASGETREEAIKDLEMMLADVKKYKAKRIQNPKVEDKE